MRDEVASGQALRQAISLMLAMNAINISLARSHGGTPLFSLPEGWEQDPPIRTGTDASKVMARVEALLMPKEGTDVSLQTLVSTQPEPEAPHSAGIEQVCAYFNNVIKTARFCE